MDGRNASKHRRMTHDFALSGLIACARYGCSVVGEFFEKMSGKWCEEQHHLQRVIKRREEAEHSCMEEGLQIL